MIFLLSLLKGIPSGPILCHCNLAPVYLVPESVRQCTIGRCLNIELAGNGILNGFTNQIGITHTTGIELGQHIPGVFTLLHCNNQSGIKLLLRHSHTRKGIISFIFIQPGSVCQRNSAIGNQLTNLLIGHILNICNTGVDRPIQGNQRIGKEVFSYLLETCKPRPGFSPCYRHYIADGIGEYLISITVRFIFRFCIRDIGTHHRLTFVVHPLSKNVHPLVTFLVEGRKIIDCDLPIIAMNIIQCFLFFLRRFGRPDLILEGKIHLPGFRILQGSINI